MDALARYARCGRVMIAAVLGAFVLTASGCNGYPLINTGPKKWTADPATLAPVSTHVPVEALYSPVMSRKDERAIGGWGGYDCGNWHHDIPSSVKPAPGSVSIVVKPEPPVSFFDKSQGTRFYIVNTTDEEVAFTAANQRVFVHQEALDSDGKWRRIEMRPQYFCGNSFHKVFLPPDQCWTLAAPRYDGPMKTKLRIVVAGNIVSEPFDGAIDPGQLEGSAQWKAAMSPQMMQAQTAPATTAPAEAP